MGSDIDHLKKKLADLEKRVSELEKDLNPPVGIPDQDDLLLSEAIALTKPQHMISASYLQTRLSIGYARATKIITQLEKLGFLESGKGTNLKKVIK